MGKSVFKLYFKIMQLWIKISNLQSIESNQQNIPAELNLNHIPCVHDQINSMGYQRQTYHI